MTASTPIPAATSPRANDKTTRPAPTLYERLLAANPDVRVTVTIT